MEINWIEGEKVMRTRQWKSCCLTGVLLLSSVALAQDRGTGREAVAGRTSVGGRKAMQDRARAVRQEQSSHHRSLLRLRSQLEQANQASFEGDNFVNIIPFVTNENGARTNIGINNFSQSLTVLRERTPRPACQIELYDTSGNLDRIGIYLRPVESNASDQPESLPCPVARFRGEVRPPLDGLRIFLG